MSALSIRKILLVLLGSILAILPMACTEDESDIGINLQSPNTLYQGIRDSAYFDAWTVYDDSLSTAGYSYGMFGTYSDPVFGGVTASLYTQVSLPNTNGISFDESIVIDSVIMTLVVTDAYPTLPNGTSRRLHVQVKQLAEPLVKDSAYTCHSSIPVGSATFFDQTVDFISDSLHLTMGSNIYELLKQTCSYDEFLARTKGLRIQLTGDGGADQALLTIDLAATKTRLTMYYHSSESTSGNLKYSYVINNSGALQFMNYTHSYSTLFQPLCNRTSDTLSGKSLLYLEPLGGMNIKIDLRPFVAKFREQHPTAIIHHAELLFPIAASCDTMHPERIIANQIYANGSIAYITDANFITNPHTYAGYDGRFHADNGCYRMRITQHLQELLRSSDNYDGTLLVIDARRTSAYRAIFNGTACANRPRIEFIYTDTK